MKSRIFVALLLMLSLLPATHLAAATDTPAFSDLQGHWASADIRYLAGLGVVNGYPDGQFRPDSLMSKAEFLTLLARTIGLPTTAAADGRHWAAGTVSALVAQGVLTTAEANGMDLDAVVTRGEMSRWIARAYSWPTATTPINSYLTDLAASQDAAAISAAVAHGIFTGYPDRTFRPGSGGTRAEVATVVTRLRDAARRPATWREQYRIAVTGDSISLNVIRVNLKRPGVTAKVGFAQGTIGATESLAGIAQRYGAIAAINGTYFQAYDSAIPMEPYGTIISGGKLLHTGWFRSAIGFWADGTARIAPINASIDGTASGAYWPSHGLNHYGRPDWGDDWAIVYTPEHGTSTGIAEGTSVVVRQGIVTEITDKSVPIPADGYLVNLNGASKQTYLKHFQVGKPVTYSPHMEREWAGVQELLQAGPRMIAGGKIALDFAGERFTEQKITEYATPRSAVALVGDDLLLITSLSASVKQLAEALMKLGARDAMCLDSGGSSGLYYDGQVISAPGRNLSNALIIRVE